MAGLGIALRGFGKALKKLKNKADNMSDKTAGNLAIGMLTGTVGTAGILAKRKKKKSK